MDFIIEAFKKCKLLFEYKEGENFNPPPNFGGLTTSEEYALHSPGQVYIESISRINPP